MVNFYRRFLPGIAHVLAPLTSATKGKGRLTWTPEMTPFFQNAKSSLATAVPLKHPDPTAPFFLATDASNSHVGPVLQQKTTGSWKPHSFFSKKQITPGRFPFRQTFQIFPRRSSFQTFHRPQTPFGRHQQTIHPFPLAPAKASFLSFRIQCILSASTRPQKCGSGCPFPPHHFPNLRGSHSHTFPSSFALVLHRHGHCPADRSLHPCPPKFPISPHHLSPHRQIPFPSR